VALRLLGLVEDVEPAAGGTLVVEGTHALTERLVEGAGGNFGHSADVRKQLAVSHPWFRALFSDGHDRGRFLQPAVVDGIGVRVTELTGGAGDAYLMHPWVLHAAAANSSNRVRSMMTHTIFGDGYQFVG
jgi:ectoine hydroxylase-related dioxygenase (phytanoyl-CoA dioxygenase family)